MNPMPPFYPRFPNQTRFPAWGDRVIMRRLRGNFPGQIHLVFEMRNMACSFGISYYSSLSNSLTNTAKIFQL